MLYFLSSYTDAIKIRPPLPERKDAETFQTRRHRDIPRIPVSPCLGSLRVRIGG